MNLPVPNLLETISILLAVASTTLAISAFIFSWVSYHRSSQMQMKAEGILAKIAERRELGSSLKTKVKKKISPSLLNR